MINYENALSIARKTKDHINHCVEYTNAYVFEHDTGAYSIGDDSPIVVMKENGEILTMIEFAVLPDKKIIKEFNLFHKM